MAKSKHSGGIAFVILVLAAGAAGVWYYLRSSAEKPPEFITASVARGDLTQTVTATGTLQAVITVDVSSQISGNIAKLYVDWNSPVKEKQVLAELDPSTYKTALLQSDGQLANAKANYALMKANADRSRELFAKNLIPQSDLDTAEAQLQQAAAQVQIQTAAHETAEVNLSRCTIYSPIDGSVISRSVDVGNTVAANLSAPTLFQIAKDLKSMQIDAAISEADIGSVREGQSVKFTVDAYPTRQFRGTVSQIRNSPKTAQNVVIYDTMIDVRNDDLRLKPGMTANVSVVVANRPAALKVPNSALRVRIADNLLPAKTETASAPGAAPAVAALKPLPDDQRRSYMTKAGFTPGSGRPSDEVIARARELAKIDGFEWPAGRFGGGNREADSGEPTTRTLYRLVGADPKTAHPEAVAAKLGITDGIATEVLDGLKEGDLVITSVILNGAKPANTPATNPFGGQGGPGGRRF